MACYISNCRLFATATSFRLSKVMIPRAFSSHRMHPPVILAMITRHLPSTPTRIASEQKSNYNYVTVAKESPFTRNVYLGILQKRTFHKDNEQDTIMLMMSHDDDDDDVSDAGIHQDEEETSLLHEWNIPELKKEVARLISRCYKKIGKASTRLDKANVQVEEIRTNPDATLDDLEACPNTGIFELELENLKDRLKKLNLLTDELQKLKLGKKKSVLLPGDLVGIIVELEVNDEPPTREVKVKKKKGPRQTVGPRLPYFQYYTENNTEIRVGRRSSDNDELSCNPIHRDGPDWWMHASGCPGSHIVIRCHDENLDQEVIRDAASLAARQSKCTGNLIKVSLTRCRDVKKPIGVAAGMVQLTGKVTAISVDMKKAEKRLSRLDKTCEKSEA
eukprot:CAMPEP_0198255074 /NCGR_PEP_ID=MMETSP1447-20131203/5301_1 /TAXON_ID=420782 /ORGANISM="Chaetoceros dichaeta, Strain CCMP1751" /LENGTH=389 /DNA_ID=CAMNT_0043941383 /DNA_START=137 /DNA_END=1309 /DNA_ORIENTATION=+